MQKKDLSFAFALDEVCRELLLVRLLFLLIVIPSKILNCPFDVPVEHQVLETCGIKFWFLDVLNIKND